MIVWSTEAVADLESAADYLLERNPVAARALTLAVLAVIERLAAEPIDGPAHVLRNGNVVRGWPVTPFRIYYERVDDTLRVVRVYHQRRDPIAR